MENLGMKKIIIVLVLGMTVGTIGYGGLKFLEKELEVVVPQTQIVGSSLTNLARSANIIVLTPTKGERVGFPFLAKGRARVFEGTVNLRLKDQENQILFEGFSTAFGQEMSEFGPFEKEIDFLLKRPATREVTLEVFWLSPRDGQELDLVSLPLEIDLGETMKMNLFFNNENLDPQFSCNKVFPVPRIIPKTQAPGRKALELLLQGPIPFEAFQGFGSSINEGVKIQRLVIEQGVARADFDEQLEQGVGGSCRVSSIRAQISQTLKQFPTVKEVIISINGRTEDILQP